MKLSLNAGRISVSMIAGISCVQTGWPNRRSISPCMSPKSQQSHPVYALMITAWSFVSRGTEPAATRDGGLGFMPVSLAIVTSLVRLAARELDRWMQ